MKWLRYLLVLVCAGSVGCSSDGGPVGTGISPTAAISGNVIDVQTDPASDGTAQAELPAIEVSIDGLPTQRTVADANGNFVLSGTFAGSVMLRFTLPQFQVTQRLDVPAGSTVVLQDIELQPDAVVAQAARQLEFFGTVDFVDCNDGTLLVHERRASGMQYHVQLGDQTGLVDGAGTAKDCAAIVVGAAVTVEGTIDYTAPDNTITALVVTLSASPPAPQQQQLQARFWGAIAALDCGTGFVIVDDSTQRTALRLTPQTRLTGSGGTLTCGDLQVGDWVRGQGQIALRAPGVIVAGHLAVVQAPSAGETLRFLGVVTDVDCTAGTLQLGDDRTRIDVDLTPSTVITNRAGRLLSCEDIGSGERVQGVGRLAADGSGVLVAAQIVVRHPGLMNPLAG